MQYDLDKRLAEKSKRRDDKYRRGNHHRERSNDEIYGVNVVNRSKMSNIANGGGSANGGLSTSHSVQQLAVGS